MRSSLSATITAGTSISDIVDLGVTGSAVGLLTSSTWTASGIQLEGSLAGINFYPMFDSFGAVVGVSSAAASALYTLDIVAAIPARYIRVRSGTSGAPVNQTNTTVVTVISRELK